MQYDWLSSPKDKSYWERIHATTDAYMRKHFPQNYRRELPAHLITPISAAEKTKLERQARALKKHLEFKKKYAATLAQRANFKKNMAIMIAKRKAEAIKRLAATKARNAAIARSKRTRQFNVYPEMEREWIEEPYQSTFKRKSNYDYLKTRKRRTEPAIVDEAIERMMNEAFQKKWRSKSFGYRPFNF